MPRSPRRPPQLTNKIFRGGRAVSRGLLTKADLRSSAWRPLFRGVYADRALVLRHDHRCRAAARFVLPAEALIAGQSAAHLYGIRSRRPDEPVEVLLPRGTRFGPVHGVQVHVAQLPTNDVRRRDGLKITSPLRTCWDLVQWLDLVDAVSYLDSFAAQRLITPAELAEYARARSLVRGWRKVIRAVALMDPAAESPQESRLRVRLVLAGLPRPVSQFVIERSGTFVARVDLAWPELRVAVEYDGLWHAAEDQFHRDRRRLNQVLGSDWTVLHLTSQRMRDDFDGFVAELRAALASARRRR
jgi:very-short-patch-repair endonuclease